MKYKLLRFSLLSILVMLCGGSVFAQDDPLSDRTPAVTLDFTTQANWNIPTSGTNTAEGTFTDGTYSIKLAAATNYKLNNGYLILGKTDSYLELPAFSFDVDYITVEGTSGASADVKQNIFVGETAVSTETTGAKNVTNQYAIASAYQAAGNVYTLKITSNHNTQISKINIYKKVSADDVNQPVITPATGVYTEAQEVSMTCSTTGATIYYTTDGTDPSANNGTEYTESFTVSTTTTVKAIAIKGEKSSNISESVITIPAKPALPWSEDWSDYSASDKPSTNNPYYSEDSGGNTKIYTGSMSAGGEEPELLVAKSGGTFTITEIDLSSLGGEAATLALLYNTNSKSLAVTTTTENVTIGDAINTTDKTYKRNIIIPAGTTTLNLTFSNSSSSNARLDNLSLVISSAPKEPTFSPAAGTYDEAQSVTITTETDGATIKYSTDGENYSVYTGPISVSETTTITAYAEKDGEESAKVSARYDITVAITSISGLNEAAAAGGSTGQSITYNFTDVNVVYVNENYNYITDGTNNALLFGSDLGLKAGDKVSGTLTGVAKTYSALPEIAVNSINITSQTADAYTPAAATVTVDQLANNVNNYIKIEGATYVSANNKNLTFKVGETNFTVRNEFGLDVTGLVADKVYDIVGFGSVYNTTYQVYATEITEATSETTGFRDIKANLTQLQELATGSNVYITVDAEGNIGTTDNAEEAAATLKGGWHGTQYGWTSFSAVVPVEGCVKITYGTHDYGDDVIVTNSNNVQVAKFNTNGAKWSSDPTNVVVAYYRTNEPTTLTFSQVRYNPYFAVEAIDEEDLPAEVTNYTVTYAAGEGTGVAPAAVEVEAGSKTTAPKNYSLYKEGYTLTGWSDGTTTYAPSDEITPEGDITLTAVYTQNEVSLADREDAVTITYALDGYNDNPKHNFQSGAGIIVTQATVNGKTIDVAVNTNGKFAHNGSGWHQVNANTTVTVPSCKGATFSVKTYEDANALKFGETAAESGATATYTATTDDATLVITQTANGYWNNLTITLPKVEQGGGEDPIINPGESDLMWDYTETAPTNNPDNGLYYGSKVNDATGTNLGLKGVKLNGSGYAFFAKNPVEGKLTLTISQRKSNGAYAVNVYACSLADGVAPKGVIIGEIAVEEGPGTGSLDIPASVTGIYIERQTSSEGVLSKIVFKEKIARTFTDFEIPYTTLKADGYTGTDLPTGVTFSGTFHDAQHGYNGATLVVPTDGGAVKFTISGCTYGNTFPVKNAAGETLASLNQKAAGCYDSGGTVTYFYNGDATTLTFGPIAYLAYFKAEAVDVEEVTVTFKDQNGTELGTKKVFEGETLGEIPFTEADLTIADGYKFRGWVYTNGVKVKATDIVDGSKSVLASVTEIEAEPTAGTIQNYDLTSNIFYPEDHENFDVADAAYYNNHGWNFAAGGSFSVKVADKAQIVLKLCEYGNGTTITVTDAAGNTVATDVPAKAESGKDGATTTVNYDGGATTLTFTFAAQSYLHKVSVFNVNDFIEKDATSGYYIVPSGDAAGLVLAINAASSEADSKVFLPNGTYDLGTTALTTISGTNVSIIGESMEGVVIKNRPEIEGISITATLLNTSTGLYMQDLTLDCEAPWGSNGANAERGVTLQDKGTQTICKNVYLKGRQDTYYCNNNNGQYYFEDGKIEGTVDYICGNGDAYFNKVTLFNTDHHNPSTGDCITAPNTPKQYGYIFNECTIDGVSAQDGKYSLGRPWAANTQVIYLNTTMKIQPLAAGWTDWSPANAVKQFAEYGSVDANDDPVDTSNRKTTFNGVENVPILNESEAQAFALETVFAGWNPAQYTEQVKTTSAKLSGKTLTWAAVDGATMYAIVKNGSIIDLTDQTSYTIADEAQGAKGLGTATDDPTAAGDTYAVRAANGRGGFGEAVVADDATGIDNITTDATGINGTITEVYSMGGARLAAPQKGVNIVKVKTNDGSVKTMKVIVK